MAQKAKKELAARNTSRLNLTLYLTLAVHAFYLLLRLLLLRRSFTTKSFVLYILLSAPSFLIQFWFERISRPKYGPTTASSTSAAGDLRSAGEDLDAKGLTEFLWDVLYWTWGCVVFAGAFGDRAWWLMIVVPAYGAWLAYSTFFAAKSGMQGMMGGAGEGEGQGSGTSKRQAKLEKRGAQGQVRYR